MRYNPRIGLDPLQTMYRDMERASARLGAWRVIGAGRDMMTEGHHVEPEYTSLHRA